MSSNEKSRIQPIQGLRAVAVIAVVLYHASIFWPDAKGAFPGGFLGVDIFFVISGYVITKSLLASIKNEKFSLSGFYIRRIKRLGPALLGLILLVVSAS